MSRIKHLFFDLDRTLWDFEANSKKALEHIFHEYKLHTHFHHFESFHHTYLKINNDLWKKYGKKKITKEQLRDTRFLKTLQQHQVNDEELALKISEAYINLSPNQTQLFPNALETLSELKNRGYILHIITNGFQEVQYIKLNNSKLSPFFDVIVCSEHIGFNKPDKRIFIHALELADAKIEESMMIGDDLQVDVLGANQVGMEAVLFDPEKKHKSRAFRVVNDLKELLEFL
ncbi:MAG: YjjG family noncanonical pyrimidine nucleotidase [Flavobacteriia bacterium]|jgi:putative hydrolase of the HAD superfamily